MEVTKEDVYDGKMLKKLVDNVVSENNDVKKILADGAYDSNDNFRYIDKMKIEPVIRVRKNSSTKAHVCSMPRKMVVIEQLRDMKRWKKKHGYGMRWIAESAFSSIKRTFGEYVSSVKWNKHRSAFFGDKPSWTSSLMTFSDSASLLAISLIFRFLKIHNCIQESPTTNSIQIGLSARVCMCNHPQNYTIRYIFNIYRLCK